MFLQTKSKIKRNLRQAIKSKPLIDHIIKTATPPPPVAYYYHCHYHYHHHYHYHQVKTKQLSTPTCSPCSINRTADYLLCSVVREGKTD